MSEKTQKLKVELMQNTGNSNNSQIIKLNKLIVVLGDNQTGKSTILSRFTKKKFVDNYISTRGVDFYYKDMTIENYKITLNIWDTNGEEITNNILPKNLYNTADCFIIVLSYEIEDSLHTLLNWLDFIKRKNMSMDNLEMNDNLCIYIIINKSDLTSRKFNIKNVEYIIQEDYSFAQITELSAKSQGEVDQLFKKICLKLTGLSSNTNINIEANIPKIETDVTLKNSNGLKCFKCW